MITDLYRYPVKGLSAERLTKMALTREDGLAGDRAMALARKPENFDVETAIAQPKQNFLMLMRDETLAALETSFDENTGHLQIRLHGESLLQADIHSAAGRMAVQQFFADYLGDPSLTPTLVQAPGHKFTDISTSSPQKMRAISLVNLASVRALEAAQGRLFHPLRFRANIYFDGLPAWAEHDWVGQMITVGGVEAQVVMRTQRCAATQVNPETAERDANVPALLKAHFGHADMGVYAEVRSSGSVSVGDIISVR